MFSVRSKYQVDGLDKVQLLYYIDIETGIVIIL